MFSRLIGAMAIMLPMFLVGCTIHPRGEREERAAAVAAERTFAPSPDAAPLPQHPTVDDLVARAMRTNQGLRQAFWEWRSAIEQIPQDATQPGNVALFFASDITKGAVASGSSTTGIGIGNDPMADILLPAKLSAAGKRALENARAAGHRFRKAQFTLRAKVISAYVDYALAAELVRLDESNTRLIQLASVAAEAREQAGLGGQSDLLRLRNELELSQNELESLLATLPARLAALNALLDRPFDAAIELPHALPPLPEFDMSNGDVIRVAAAESPDLGALDREVAAAGDSIDLAKLQYLPDLSLSATTDLAGIAQSLMGMMTLPLFRHEAIDAAVAQAEANLKARQAMQQQMRNDIASELVLDLSTFRDAHRQLRVLHETVLPRAQQIVEITRSSYQAGQGSLLDHLDAERSLIALQRLEANLRAAALTRLADLESLAGRPIAQMEFNGPKVRPSRPPIIGSS